MADKSAATDESPLPPPAVPAGPRSASDSALDRYGARMRRGRTVYYAVLAAVVVALGTWVGVVWSTGEEAHASLHTFRPAPRSVAVQRPSATQTEVWNSTDRIAIGAPQAGGTIVTFSRHTVGGRDALTGKRTWSYTRTDRDVCTAAQFPGPPTTTIAIYAKDGNCDQLSAFNSQTGQRRWTRTLDMDGMPLNGAASFQAVQFTLVVASHAVIYAIDPVTGYNRWTYTRFGCRIGRVVLGSTGALISQNCSAEVKCKGVKFCASGPQLLLRDGETGRDDDNKANADRMKWIQRGTSSVPASADLTVSAVAGSSLQLLDAKSGKSTAAVPLVNVPAHAGEITSVATSDGDVVWVAGEAYALRAGTAAAVWHRQTLSAPVVMTQSNGTSPALADARITVATDTGIAILDGNTGKVSRRFAVQAPAAGSEVYSLGTGFLVAGSAGIVSYR